MATIAILYFCTKRRS